MSHHKQPTIKAVLLLAISFLLPFSSYAQNILTNNGIDVEVDSGAIFYINGDVSNENGGGFDNEGTIHLTGNWRNIAGTRGFLNSSRGHVILEGDTQMVGGTDTTFFYNLQLQGNGPKKLAMHSVTEGVLGLNDRELATSTYRMIVTNTDTGAVTRTSGFVSSNDTGALVRQTDTTAPYRFPVGSADSGGFYRPVTIQPDSNDANTYSVRLANSDPNQEGFPRSNAAPGLCQLNGSYYHRINRLNGDDPATLGFYFQNQQDGYFTDVAHWQGQPRWESTAPVSLTAQPAPAFDVLTVAQWDNFAFPAFALAKDGPPVDAGTGDTICPSDTAMLTATGSGQLTWSTGDSTASIAVTPDTTTIYSVTATDTSGCTASDSVTVVVSQQLTTEIDTSICQGDTIVINGIKQTTGDTYRDTLRSTSGCDSIVITNVTVDSLPVADAGENDTICQGTSTTLNASGGVRYEWSNDSMGSSINVSPQVDRTYRVTVTDSNSCTANDSVAVAIKSTYQTLIDTAICAGDTLMSGGEPKFSTGVTANTLQASNQCDSVVITDLTVYPAPPADASEGDTVCRDTKAIINATGGTDFVWSTGDSTATITVTPTQSTAYTVTVTDTNGCTATDSTVFNTRQTYQTLIDTTICEGDSLLAAGSHRDSSGLFTDTLTAANSCDSVVTTDLTVAPLPAADAGPDDTLCSGSTVTLTASGRSQYSWSNGGSSSSIQVAPEDDTTYMVTVVDTNGCRAKDSVSVTVQNNYQTIIDTSICQGDTLMAGDTALTTGGTYYDTLTAIDGCDSIVTTDLTVEPLPAVSVSAGDSLCPGESSFLIGAGNGTFQWSTGSSAQQIQVQPDSTQFYTLTVTGNNGCSASDSSQVALYNQPTADAGPDRIICIGDTATLAAAAYDSIQWSTGSTDTSIHVSPTAGTHLYTVTITNTNGCKDSDSVQVTAIQNPQVNLGPDRSVCGGTVLDAQNSGATYLWSTGDTTRTITVTKSGTYSVKTSYGNNCSAMDTVAITVKPVQTAELDSSVTACGSATLDPQGTFPSLNWSTGDTSQMLTIASSGTYAVTTTDTNNCTATDTAEVTVLPLPDVQTSPDTSMCEGGSVQISAYGGSSYEWAPAASLNYFYVQSPVASPDTSTMYTVTVKDSNQCSAKDSVWVAVQDTPPQPSITATNDTLTTGGGFSSYQWYRDGSPVSGAEDSVHVAQQSGIFSVEVINARGCLNRSPSESVILTGIKETKDGKWQLFPNPTSSKVQVTGSNLAVDKVRLKVYNQVGQLIKNKHYSIHRRAMTTSLDFSNLAEGVYFLRVENGDAEMLRSFRILRSR